jgi:CRISPR-associated endonuclease/helicase Cas3
MLPALQTAEVATTAYRLHTDGAISQATDWQGDLYDRLSMPDSDAGYLLLTPTGAGKTEAVVIPALGLHRGGAPRRLFLIGPDGSPLDDYLYRLVPYLKASVGGDETPRTLCLDIEDSTESEGNLCRRFFADGSEDPSIERNPLEADVDLVLTTFSSFRALFFGGGGIHALPSNIGAVEGLPLRRDLFFFDEAHAYGSEEFGRFHRLVEFLFAEDTDLVIGSTTMPASYAEELNFLEAVQVTHSLADGPKTLQYRPTADPLQAIEREIRRAYFQNARVFGVTESVADAEDLYARLVHSYPHSVYVYHATQAPEDRRRIYAQLRELEKEGEGYLLLTTGPAIETSDLDASILLSTLCPPENLIRRAGRCNRRGDLPDAQIVLFGDTLAPTARPLPTAEDYLAALDASSGDAFDAETWKRFI